MTARQLFLTLMGFLLLGAAALSAAWLNSGSSWRGLVGFWGVLGVPGLMTLASASRRIPPRLILPLLPATVSLAGLDVIDSARREIVFAGYLWFGVLLTAAVVLTWSFRRGGPTAPLAHLGRA